MSKMKSDNLTVSKQDAEIIEDELAKHVHPAMFTDFVKRALIRKKPRRNFDRFATVDEARNTYALECGKTFNEHCAKCQFCPDDTTYARFVSWLFGNVAKKKRDKRSYDS